jgi:hypothetical protein
MQRPGDLGLDRLAEPPFAGHKPIDALAAPTLVSRLGLNPAGAAPL